MMQDSIIHHVPLSEICDSAINVHCFAKENSWKTAGHYKNEINYNSSILLHYVIYKCPLKS